MSQTKSYYLVSPFFTKVPHLLASGARLLYARIYTYYILSKIKSIELSTLYTFCIHLKLNSYPQVFEIEVFYNVCMEIKNLLSKYQAMEFKTDGTLFGIDPLIAVVQHKCPYCHCKLYPMRDRPFHYCKSKSHKNKFIIASNKLK